MSSNGTMHTPIPRSKKEAPPHNGKVEHYWDTNSFSWFGEEAAVSKGGKQPYININTGGRITISNEAANLSEIIAGEKVKIGINKHFIAIRKLDTGIIVRPIKSRNSKAVYIIAKKVTKEILALGWELPCRAPCTLDEKNQMLVAKKPKPEGQDE